jgi:ribosomal silencing factor RsfS
MKSAELAAEGEDLNVQPGWEDTMVTLLADFGKQVQAIIDQVKADAQPIPEPDENFDEEVDEPEDEDLDDL